MAESAAKVTGLYFPLKGTADANATQVLAALSRMTGGIGSTQEELVKTSRQLARLEQGGFVRSFLCQESTAGPFARRYRLAEGIAIEVKAIWPA